MNPFIPFCLFVASLAFVHHLKDLPDDQEIRASLEFLLRAMQALKKRNPLSESFLIQLRFNIAGTSFKSLLHNIDFSESMMKGPVRRTEPFNSVPCNLWREAY